MKYSLPRWKGDKTRLVKDGLSFNTAQCLSFYYFLHGGQGQKINVYVGQDKIFTLTGNYGNLWRQAKLNVPVTPGASQVGTSIIRAPQPQFM